MPSQKHPNRTQRRFGLNTMSDVRGGGSYDLMALYRYVYYDQGKVRIGVKGYVKGKVLSLGGMDL